jgi:hypothetical protein
MAIERSASSVSAMLTMSCSDFDLLVDSAVVDDADADFDDLTVVDDFGLSSTSFVTASASSSMLLILLLLLLSTAPTLPTSSSSSRDVFLRLLATCEPDDVRSSSNNDDSETNDRRPTSISSGNLPFFCYFVGPNIRTINHTTSRNLDRSNCHQHRHSRYRRHSCYCCYCCCYCSTTTTTSSTTTMARRSDRVRGADERAVTRR